MNSEKIEFDDFIAPDVAERLMSFIDQVQSKIKSASAEISSAASKLNGKTSGGISWLDTAKKESDALRRSTEQLTMAHGKLAEKIATNKAIISEVNAETKQQAKLNLTANDSLKAMEIELAKLRNQYASLGQAQRDNNKIGGQILENINKQDVAVKNIRKSMGQHQLEVGNYALAQTNLKGKVIENARALSGMAGILDILGRVLGVNTEQLQGLASVHTTLRELSRDLTHIKIGETVATEGHTAAVEAETVAEEEEAVAAGLSTGGIILLIAGVVAAGVAIYEYVGYLKEEKLQLEANQEVEKENLKILAESANLRAKTAKERADNQTDEDVANNKITKAQGDKDKLWREREDAVKEILDSQNESLQKLATAYGIDLNSYGQFLGKKTAKEIKFDNESQAIKEASLERIRALNEKYAVDANKVDSDNKKVLKEAIKKEKAELLDWQKEKNDINVEAHETNIENQKAGEDEWTKYLADIEAQRYKDFLQSEKDKTKEEQDYWTKQQAIADAARKKSKEAEQKLAEEQIKMEQSALTSIQQAEDAANLKKKNALAYQTSIIQDSLTQQGNLAAQGLANTYDFELKEKAKALDAQKKLDKKAAHEKEAMQLAEVFLEFEKVYAKDKNMGAAGKALAATLAAKGIASGLAAAFGETGGILGETLQPGDVTNKRHASGNDMLLVAEKGEGLISVNDMNNLKYGILPSWMANKMPDINQNYTVSNEEVVSGLKEVKKAVENNGIQIARNAEGDLVISTKQNGINTHRIQKTYPIIERNTYRK